MVNDRIVCLWAANYFKHSNEELGIKEKKVSPPPVKKAENETQQDEKEQKKEDEKNAQISIFSEVA